MSSKKEIREAEELESYLLEAIDNIRSDRAIASTLLTDLMIQMKQQASLSTHESTGSTASKYLETLQRSNEQMVKLLNMLQKRESAAATDSLEDLDHDKLFEILDKKDNSE